MLRCLMRPPSIDSSPICLLYPTHELSTRPTGATSDNRHRPGGRGHPSGGCGHQIATVAEFSDGKSAWSGTYSSPDLGTGGGVVTRYSWPINGPLPGLLPLRSR